MDLSMQGNEKSDNKNNRNKAKKDPKCKTKEEISRYVEKVERDFMEDTFSVAESRVVIENVLQEWYAF